MTVLLFFVPFLFCSQKTGREIRSCVLWRWCGRWVAFFSPWKWEYSRVDKVCVQLTECVFLSSWRKAPSFSYRCLCIRNWSDICGSELESSCLFQQGSHVVLRRKGLFCLDALIAHYLGLKKYNGWGLKKLFKLCLCTRAWNHTWSNHRQLPNFIQLLFWKTQRDSLGAFVWVHSTSFMTLKN